MLVLIFFGILLAFFIYFSKKPKGFPPGFPRLPIVGSIPFMPKGLKTRERMFRLGDYGPIVGMYLGNTPTVFLNDVNYVKEAFKSEFVINRPSSKGPLSKFRYGDDNGNVRGLLLSNGVEWFEQRKFTLRHLKDLGFGKMIMEDIIVEEVEKLCDLLDKEEGTLTTLNLKMNISIINALWVILVGEKLDLEDPKLKDVILAIDKVIRYGSTTPPLYLRFFPWMVKFVSPKRLERVDSLFKAVESLVYPAVDQHLNTFDSESINDFVDMYINEIQKTTNKDSSFYKDFGEKSLRIVLIDLFVAGTETTSSSLLWTILFLLKYPKVQDKIHKELDSVIGSRSVRLKDQAKLPYINAVILESMRLASLVPLGIPHCTSREIKLGKYTIPKDTDIFANMIYIHYDPNYWKSGIVYSRKILESRWEDIAQ